MKLDRGKAIEYAKANWDTVFDDCVFWLTEEEVNVARKRRELSAPASDGWAFRFVPDGLGAEHAVFQRTAPAFSEKEVWPWAGLADCAHYLSRCLTAGGIPISFLYVPKMIDALKARGDTRTLAEMVTKTQGQKIIDSGVFAAGDLIG